MSFKKKIKNKVRDVVRCVIPVRYYIRLRFYLTHGYFCDLNEPKTWNEKIQFRKLNTPPELLSKFVDKYTVRQYVSETIGDQYLIPLIAKFRKMSLSDFDNLPSQFVIKTSNGGGGENVKIVYDKDSEDLSEITERFNKYINEKIGSKIDERFYDIETPYILIEKLIIDENGKLPSDYKCHFFNGKEKKIFVQLDQGRFIDHKRSIFDEFGSVQPFSIQGKYPSIERNYQFPDGFSSLLEKAALLSTNFDYVRVDMYFVGGKVYFGELTFCHGSGWEPVSPREYDKLLGSYWKV